MSVATASWEHDFQMSELWWLPLNKSLGSSAGSGKCSRTNTCTVSHMRDRLRTSQPPGTAAHSPCPRGAVASGSSRWSSARSLAETGVRPQKQPEHENLARHAFWYPPYVWPWNQNLRSLCLCGLWVPMEGSTLPCRSK